jgi:hypothetical protein
LNRPIVPVLVLLIATLAAPLHAQDATPPRFFLERIEVRDARRVSHEVIIAESRLRAGQDYSEADLRDASARLTRLPFLLSAEFSLEKGTERGQYVLVVTVVETKPFFYALDIRPIQKDDYRVSADFTDQIGASDRAATLGMRWFVGRRGAVHTAVVANGYDRDFADDYSAFAVGYTQYDIFGTRAFATVNLKQVFDADGTALSPQLVVGIPLSPNQTLTLDVEDTRFGRSVRRIGSASIETSRGQRVFAATWSYNTTNHPFVPTRGTLLSISPRAAYSDAATYSVTQFVPGPPDPIVRAGAIHTQAREIAATAARYWEFSERSSVSGGLEGAWGSFETRSRRLPENDRSDETLRGAIFAGYSFSLWAHPRTRNGDSRLELNLRIGDRSGGNDPEFFEQNFQQLSASWVRRSSWGTLRLGAGYAW